MAAGGKDGESSEVMEARTNDERASMAVLRAVLDTLIPASENGTLPSAGTLGLESRVWQDLERTPALAEMVREGLRSLDATCRQRHGVRFTEANEALRRELLAEQSFLLPVFLHTLIAYYREPAVLEALGLPARPPHPLGYTMADA